MPVLETPLFDYVSTELAALVGDRVYPIRGAEGTELPYITYTRVSAIRSYTHDAFGSDTGRAWVEARIQFNCWAAEMLTAINIGEALVAALSNYSGPMGTINIGRCDILLELDAYEEATKLYRRIVDVVFAHEEGA